jgi:hypothetical protein
MEDYNKERQIILDMGEQNGYKNVTVEGVINKQERKKNKATKDEYPCEFR